MFTCTLNPQARQPLRDQLADALRRELAAGNIAAGERLPGRRQLAEQLAVAPSTVDAAYAMLIEEGLLESRPRSGVFALAPERAPAVDAAPEIRWDFGTAAADAERFPYSTWAKLLREVLSGESSALLTAGDARGSLRLRREIAGLLRRVRGLEADPECIAVGAGTEVLLSGVVQVIGRERLFAVEDPGYPRARRILAAGGARIAPTPLVEGGIDVGALYQSGAGAAYVTPSHQFPTGQEMTKPQRQALLSWSRETGGCIVEDDYDSEFRMSGEPVPALRQADERVIYLNTFSRTLAPGLRLGFVVLPEDMMARWRQTHAACSVSTFEQETLASFIACGAMERHIARMRKVYGARLTCLQNAVNAHGLGVLHPCRAGLYAVLETAGPLPAEALIPCAREAGILLTRVSDHALLGGEKEDRRVLLGFAGMDEAAIEAGVAALSRAWGIEK